MLLLKGAAREGITVDRILFALELRALEDIHQLLTAFVLKRRRTGDILLCRVVRWDLLVGPATLLDLHIKLVDLQAKRLLGLARCRPRTAACVTLALRHLAQGLLRCSAVEVRGPLGAPKAEGLVRRHSVGDEVDGALHLTD